MLDRVFCRTLQRILTRLTQRKGMRQKSFSNHDEHKNVFFTMQISSASWATRSCGVVRVPRIYVYICMYMYMYNYIRMARLSACLSVTGVGVD
jgi:hypothetical protein